MMQTYQNLEIIVSDDCSSDGSVDIVKECIKEDSRIIHFEHDVNIGMRDNFEYALSKVRPGFVIALGGDDGLAPGCIEKMLHLLESTKTELLTWQASKFIYPGMYAETGTLMFSKRRGVKVVKSVDFLSRMSTNLNYNSDEECPMFYIKGVVSTRLVDLVRSRSLDKRFYSCPTPDGYSVIVLAGEVDTYSFTYEPLSVLGSSPSSQGVSYLRNDRKSVEESNRFFQQNQVKPMHKELASQPYSPLISLMTADYLLTARDLPGWNGVFPALNYKNILEKSFQELTSAYYSKERVGRELGILKEIAKQHSLIKEYDSLLKSTRKKRYHIRNIVGMGFGANSYYIDSSIVKASNVHEASTATYYLYNVLSRINVRSLYDMTLRTIKYFVKMRIVAESIQMNQKSITVNDDDSNILS